MTALMLTVDGEPVGSFEVGPCEKAWRDAGLLLEDANGRPANAVVGIVCQALAMLRSIPSVFIASAPPGHSIGWVTERLDALHQLLKFNPKAIVEVAS